MKKLNSPLALALLLSLAVHAVLLTVRFVAPEQFNRVFKDTALEVILVNAQSQERPEHAQAIAQANLAGGGDVAQGRATSPMPYSALTRIGDDFEERQRQIDALQERQTTLLTQLRPRLIRNAFSCAATGLDSRGLRVSCELILFFARQSWRFMAHAKV